MTYTTKPLTAADFAACAGNYLAEIDGDMLSIIRADTDQALTYHGKAFCKAFRDSVKYSGAESATRVYIKLAPYQASDKGQWGAPPYKRGHAARIIAEMESAQ